MTLAKEVVTASILNSRTRFHGVLRAVREVARRLLDTRLIPAFSPGRRPSFLQAAWLTERHPRLALRAG